MVARGASRAVLLLLLSSCAVAPSAPVVHIPESQADDTPRAGGPSAVETKLDASRFVGRWEGVGHQSGGESWPMAVDMVGIGPGVCARATYPTLPCAAEWICRVTSPQAQIVLAEEHITEGQDACVDGGQMTIDLSRDGHLVWSWAGSGETASAVLSRKPR